ncbi:HNH endonuclease family protein [Enterococcus faecalis]|nr:HNH endonuclease family protein [Enterococcus faecalis]MDK0510397.1 HNH endonuclease family protein [Enterococcus faecalis]
MLLKSRVLFDKFVLKREYARDYKETGKWSLQKLEKYTDNKGNKPKYVGTFGGDEDNRNKQIRTLQSALRITYTSPKTMHWISLILTSCLNNDDSDILQILEAYGQTKVDASGYTTATGFSFERIVFSYLDYLLYRNGYSYNGKEVVRPLADDWQFQFRSSIEHFYPQHPTELVVWANEDLNCFGNLALITVSGNSTFNNAMPVGKASTNPGIIEQSLKLKIMTEMMRQNDNNWNQELAHKHQREMFNVLEKG